MRVDSVISCQERSSMISRRAIRVFAVRDQSIPRLSSTSSTFALFLSHSPVPLFVLFFLVSYPVDGCVGGAEQTYCRGALGFRSGSLPLGSTGMFSTRRFLELWMTFKHPAARRLHSSCSSLESLWRFPRAVVCSGIRFCGSHVQVLPSRSRYLQRLRAHGVHGTQAVFWMDALLNPTWHLHFRPRSTREVNKARGSVRRREDVQSSGSWLNTR